MGMVSRICQTHLDNVSRAPQALSGRALHGIPGAVRYTAGPVMSFRLNVLTSKLRVLSPHNILQHCVPGRHSHKAA